MRLRQCLRTVSVVVLVAFTSFHLQPTIAAFQTANKVVAANEPSADAKYAKALDSIEQQAQKAKHNRSRGTSSKDPARAIRQLTNDLAALDRDIESAFAATASYLASHQLAQLHKDRHAAAVAAFKDKRAQIQALLSAVAIADDKDAESERDAALTNLSNFFNQNSQVRGRAPLTPNNLPWRSPKQTVRAPITTSGGYAASHLSSRLHVAGPIPTGVSVPKVLPQQPNSDDLAPTDDAQITTAISAKALELGNDPLAIYRWVRNNVRFVPTYGSIQGSQQTLDTQSGNAFDTASLLIAMLRAARIPARYSYATIEVPAAQAMNWVGGATRVEAAEALLAQGGIPSAPRISQGTVTSIVLEHVSVEAWIDFVPSRGARNKTPGSWVPMDPSFKQYDSTAGINLVTSSSDASVILSALQQGATVNASEGSVVNLNQANLQQAITTYNSDLQSRIDSQKTNATVADVLGTTKIRPSTEVTFFAGTLPYRVVAQGPRYSALPDSLRHQFRYSLYASASDRSLDVPIWTFQRSLPSLAGKKMTLSFRPTTQADYDFIASYVPTQPHADGSPVTPADLPSAIPPYASVIPELRVDGELVASGGSFLLGTELAGQGGFTENDFSGWDLTPDDTLVAGQLTAIGISAEGISTNQLFGLETRIEQVKQRLESNSGTGITGEQMFGDLLTMVIWSYFAEVAKHGFQMQRVAGMIDLPGKSYGLFHAAVQPIKLFGTVITSVRFTGLMMDVGHLRHDRVAKDNQGASLVRYNRARGQFASLMESQVPESYLLDRSTCGVAGQVACEGGVSAVKLIAAAATQGQKIYRITQANAQVIDQVGARAETLDEIRNAVAAGKEVTVHERPVTWGQWSGVGLTIIDPETGAGAYLIEGGANGMFWVAFWITAICFAAAIAMIIAGPVFWGIALFIWEFVNLLLWVHNLNKVAAGDEKAWSQANAGHTLIALLGLVALGEVVTAELVRWMGAFLALIMVETLS